MEKYSAIFELWAGEMGVGKMQGQSEDYDKLASEVVERERILLDKIKDMPELLAVYKNMDDVLQSFTNEEAKIMYRFGVRFGFLLAMDIFSVQV